jgi:hypothetical protein
MSYKRTLGLIAAAAAMGTVIAACGSSGSGPTDGGLFHRDGGAILGSDGGEDGAAEAGLPADGTSGIPCTSDAQCVGDSGAGINRCSNRFAVTIGTQQVSPWPTPICIVPPTMAGNCNPAPPTDPAGNYPHYCDGPDLPSSPGVCVPDPNTGLGTCYPKCTYGPDATAATGCAGHDTCSPQFFVGSRGQVSFVGFCFGTCEKDSDCSAFGRTSFCQLDIGGCSTRKVIRPKPPGTPCTMADNTSGACDCLISVATGFGYCTTSCVVGGVPCPSGFQCDNQQSPTVTLQDQSTGVVTAEAARTQGACFVLCPGSGDAGPGVPVDAAPPSDAGASEAGAVDASAGPLMCPTNSTCTSMTLAGPECMP